MCWWSLLTCLRSYIDRVAALEKRLFSLADSQQIKTPSLEFKVSAHRLLDYSSWQELADDIMP